MRKLVSLSFSLFLAACAVSSHETQKSTLGVPRSSADMLAVIDQPGPVTVETVESSQWEVDRSGLINLKHPRAKEAGLQDGPEPIQIYFHVLRHPTRGTFIVDTGVERKLRDNPDEAAIQGMVASAMHREKLKFTMPLGDWLAKEQAPLQGVFLTHLHLDHIMGMPDVPASTPIFMGPGEADEHSLMNMFVKGTANRELEGKGAISEWAYTPDPSGRFEGVLDLFGDGSVWAIWVPGHTAGSTAYLVRTPTGPVLLTGDASHTRWGWEHDVEPGTFSADMDRSVESFKKLRALAAEHPAMSVRFGHQR